MYRARDQVTNECWLDNLESAADELDLNRNARERAAALFLSSLPADERSKPATIAASLYAGALIAGERRSQRAVADAVGVARLTVQKRWKPLLGEAGLEPPTW